MTIANMVIVELKPFNEAKRADRLLQNEMVIYGGRVGIVKDAKFDESAAYVTVNIRFVTKLNGKSTVAQEDTVELKTSRDFEFNVVGIVTK